MANGILGTIFGYKIYQTSLVTKLSTKIYTGRFIYLDYWSILHFIFFYLIGIIYPNKWILVITGSILFEIIEEISSKKIQSLKEIKIDTITDIGINLLGYWIAQRFPII